MSFDIDKFFRAIYDSTSVRGFFNNPIYVGIVIVLVMMVIVIFMFADYREDNDDFWANLLRTGIYMLLPILALLFLHYKNTEREFEDKYTSKSEAAVVGATTKGQGEMSITEELFGLDNVAQQSMELPSATKLIKINDNFAKNM